MADILGWINGIGGALGLGYNIYENERNHQAQQRQLALENERYIENRDYQRSLQQKVFEREDTAIQRASLDAQKAGFSPLTVAGNGSASGALVGSSYQAPSNGQVSFTPIDTMALVRGLQEMSIAQDANDRAERATNADIAFKQAQLDNETQRIGFDFMLRNAEMFNNYQLASEELRQRGAEFDWNKTKWNKEFEWQQKKWSDEQNNFSKRLLLDVERMRQDNMQFASNFAREGVWRAEDIERAENKFKWQKGEDTIGNIMNFGNLLVDILGVLNGGNRR